MNKPEYKQFSELKKKMRLVVCTHNKLAKGDFSTDALAYVKRDGKAFAQCAAKGFVRIRLRAAQPVV